MSDQFVFKKSDKVGVADAAEDQAKLLENFVDTGDYSTVADFQSVERFILGGAGIGKTALVTKLVSTKDHVIVINPESLSMSYISSSNIISYLTELNVNFDLFYRMLWRHVLVIEILKSHFGIDDEGAKVSALDKLKMVFEHDKKKKAHLKSLEYLQKWGPKFWQTTNLRVKEIKDNFENKIESKLGTDLKGLTAAIDASSSNKKEVISEVTDKVKEVLSSVQMKELSDLIKLIDDAIDDPQKQYYLIIDKLDDNWVEETIRYQLIKALLDTVKDFVQASQVKPIIVLRSDLISRVFDKTKLAGMQEEKYTSLYLNVSWSAVQLISMLDERIKSLVRSRYTKQLVTHSDLLPKVIKGKVIEDYLIERSLMRPRYIIEFFNECIKQAAGSPVINETMLLLAEREYSRGRRSAIEDEWRSVYPSLSYWAGLLDSTNHEFFVNDIGDTAVISLLNQYDLGAMEDRHDRMAHLVKDYLSNVKKDALVDFKKDLIVMFYACGYLGITTDDGIDYWSYGTRKLLKANEIHEDTVIKINPTFYFAFGVRGVH